MTPTAAGHHSLAYKNEEFLESDAGRPLRILAEYLEPLASFRREKVQDTVVFFGSARLSADGPLGRYYEEARELARLVTTWSKGISKGADRCVVCTGGGGGIMEAANRGASEAGGRTIGLNIGLPREQLPNRYLTPELSVANKIVATAACSKEVSPAPTMSPRPVSTKAAARRLVVCGRRGTCSLPHAHIARPWAKH